MKKILLIGPILRNLKGFRKELIQRLLDEGYDVTLASAFKQEETQGMDERLHFIDVFIDRRGTSILSDILLCKNYIKILNTVKPDCVLTYTTKCGVYGGIACTLKKIPYIVNNSGLYNPDDFSKPMWFILNTLFKLGYTHAKCLMHQNTYEQSYLDKLAGYKPKSILLPGSGVNMETYSYCPYPPYDGKLILNYLARIVNIKGINELVEAARLLRPKYTNFEIRLYGTFESPKYQELVEAAEKEGLVKYCGSTNDVPSVIKVCHGVVHPSYYEGMTNVVLEHSAMGRPCLGSDIPGVRESIEDGKTGYLFAPKNSNSLAAAIEKFILHNHEERMQMGINAHDKMVREFDRNIVVDKYMREIEEIVKL